MAQPYPVVGIEATGIHPRLEVRDLQRNPIQFSLFIRAFNNVLNMNSTDSKSPDYIEKPNSWWQMGGIHGLPYNPWSGDPNGFQKLDPNASWGGYCYHASALFPTWHRVVVMLVEQALVNEAIAIASKLNNDTWLQAAKELRFPYWDWTRRETATEGIPLICRETEVTIVNPDGSPSQVSNPLNHYKFTLKPGDARGFEYMGHWDRTYRWANQDVNPTKELYDEALEAYSTGTILKLGGGSFPLKPVSWLREKVAALFTYDLTLKDSSYGPNMWGYFSSAAANFEKVEPPMPVMPPSIEEPHNMVHLDTGGNGSMSTNDYAGFDPIFILHHCNVDRIYAFWEYLYPEYWIGNGWTSTSTGKPVTIPFITFQGSFWQNANAPVNHATTLVPFRTKALDYWTSDNTRGLLKTSPTQKYYTYPAIKDPKSSVEVKVDVPYDVNNLALRKQYQQILHDEWRPNLPIIIQTHGSLSREMPQHVGLLMKEEDNVVYLRQFFIVGQLPEFAFTGSYRLELHLLPKDGHQTESHVVNNISVLARTDPDRCAACIDRRAAGSHIGGHMYLDPRIILYLISQLEPAQREVITELDHLAVLIQGSLAARLVKPDGTKFASTDPPVGTNHTPLEEAKAPQLTLHSHVIQLEPDTAALIEIGQHTTHGTFRERSDWRTF